MLLMRYRPSFSSMKVSVVTKSRAVRGGGRRFATYTTGGEEEGEKRLVEGWFRSSSAEIGISNTESSKSDAPFEWELMSSTSHLSRSVFEENFTLSGSMKAQKKAKAA